MARILRRESFGDTIEFLRNSSSSSSSSNNTEYTDVKERMAWTKEKIRNVILVITGTTGTLSESFRKYLSNIPGKHEVKELQKTAILGTTQDTS